MLLDINYFTSYLLLREYYLWERERDTLYLIYIIITLICYITQLLILLYYINKQFIVKLNINAHQIVHIFWKFYVK